MKNILNNFLNFYYSILEKPEYVRRFLAKVIFFLVLPIILFFWAISLSLSISGVTMGRIFRSWNLSVSEAFSPAKLNEIKEGVANLKEILQIINKEINKESEKLEQESKKEEFYKLPIGE
jgi:hypothetical protein